MKLLVLGDFHGTFPKKLQQIVKKDKIDAIVSNGDYLPFSYRKLWFKHCYRKDIELWEIIGKDKYKKLVLQDLRKGEYVLKKMNNLKIPVITVLGNVDYTLADDVVDKEKTRGKRYWSFDWKRNFVFIDLIKKYHNIKLIDYDFFKCRDFIFIGARGSSFPGRVKSRAYRIHKVILKKLFVKFSEENKERKVIFVSHNVPYNTKLDLIKGKDADKGVRGKHYGSKLVKRVIDKHQPVLHIGGHIHESRGIQKLGRTICVNPGAIHVGHYAIVDVEEKGIVKVVNRKI